MNAAACPRQTLRAPRANRVFQTDEKRIRTKNRVMDKPKDALGVLIKIDHHNPKYLPALVRSGDRSLRAPRA
ncbi:MAG: hypothetical protein AAB150_12465, partial [Pseudomonadota bacterium]